MDQSRWKKIDELLQQALDLPTTERDSFLSKACNGDEALRSEVHSLLAADRQMGEFLDQPLLSRETEPSATGRRIGVYRIESKIGHGGMGTVYLARRDDDQQFDQQVAIKLIKRGMDTDEIIERFRYERRILASLNHPNIARLLDGGTTEDGLPYFVMEFIEGEALPTYCERKKLSVTERLKLFLQVCSAVQHAHNNFVVHRDLKPSNILVAKNDSVKLLDFGIAKLLNAEEAGLSTLLGQRPMTPEYASPEQIRGEAITTASDVYSLGIVLYELLTDQRPYQFRQRNTEEISDFLREHEPQLPSQTVTNDKQRRELQGDLDNIVMMAIRKEPESRYRSVAQLAEDIERHLSGQTVAARPKTFSYRTVKFIKRNRAGVVAAAMLLVTLMAGIIATSWQARIAKAEQRKAIAQSNNAQSQQARAEQEKTRAEAETSRAEKALEEARTQRNRAEQSLTIAETQRARAETALIEAKAERAKAESEKSRAETERAKAERRFNDVRKLATSFLFEFHESIRDLPGATKAQELVIQKAQESLDSLAQDAKDDLQLRRELATAYYQLGAIQNSGFGASPNVGKINAAVASHRRAVSLRESVIADAPDDLKTRSDLANSYLILSQVLVYSGNEDEAYEASRRGLKLREEIATLDPAKLEWQQGLLQAYRTFFFTAGNLRHFSACYESLGKGVKLGEKLMNENPDKPALAAQYALTLAAYGTQRRLRGEIKCAWSDYRQAEKILDDIAAKMPDSRSAQRNPWFVKTAIIDSLNELGNPVEALRLMRERLTIAEAAAAQDPANQIAQIDMGQAHERVSQSLFSLGDLKGATDHYRINLATLEKVAAADRDNTRYSRDLASSYTRMGELLAAIGETEQALAMLKKANAIYEPMIAREPKSQYLRREFVRHLYQLAKLTSRAGQVSEAREHTRRALAIQKFEADHPEAFGILLNEYAWPLLTCEPADMRDAAAALPYAKLAVEQTHGNDPNILKTLALAYHLTGDQAAAIQTAKKALALLPTGESGRSVLRRDLEELVVNAEKAVGNR